MSENETIEYQNIFQQIVAQFFQMKQINDCEESYYMLEYGAQDRISVTTTDATEINDFIKGFFNTCVSKMRIIKENENTLIIPCIFRFLDCDINNKSSSTTQEVKITINSTIVPKLFQLYFIPRN